MPEEHPLKALITLKIMFETEGIFAVRLFREIQQLGRGLYYYERRSLCVVN